MPTKLSRPINVSGFTRVTRRGACGHARSMTAIAIAIGVGVGVGVAACSGSKERAKDERNPESQVSSSPTRVARPEVVIEGSKDRKRPPFDFSPDDEKFLNDVQHGAFNFFWSGANAKTGMVPDRSSVTLVSVAGVGFQLSALPIGVERGWVTKAQANERARLILTSLISEPTNRKRGLFYHYLDGATAAPSNDGYEKVVSTIDSALLFAGVITASSYFGGEVAVMGDRLIDEADWAFYSVKDTKEPWFQGMITLAWKPDNRDDPTGDGKFVPYYWADCGDEQKLVTFLAASAPVESRRGSPDLYYRLRRQLGEWNGETQAWFPWSGALFTSFFAHCWIDYAGMGPDSPAAHGILHRARVDWWENSRRVVNMHRDKAKLNSGRVPTLGENAWGLTASDAAQGYAVPGLFPRPMKMAGARAEYDYAVADPKDDFGDGTIAPYAAGCSILFEPAASIAAMRFYASLKRADGTPLVWRDPATGGRGFLDSFNLGNGSTAAWAAADDVAIDQGPLILAIENARTGLIWKLFHTHPTVRAGMERLGLNRTR